MWIISQESCLQIGLRKQLSLWTSHAIRLIKKKKNDKKSSAAKTKIKKAHIVFPPLEQEHKSLRAVRRALGHWRSVSLSSGHGRGRLGFALAVSAGASRLALQQSQASPFGTGLPLRVPPNWKNADSSVLSFQFQIHVFFCCFEGLKKQISVW